MNTSTKNTSTNTSTNVPDRQDSDLVTCAFCGHRYRPEDSRSACGNCPLHPKGRECGWLRCPNCGYETPRESGWLKGVRHWLGGGRKASSKAASHQVAPCPEDASSGHSHPLSSLPAGYQGRVAFLATKDQRKLQKLMAFGILPGMPVKVLQTRPSIVFQVGQTQLAVDEGIAGDILVGKE